MEDNRCYSLILETEICLTIFESFIIHVENYFQHPDMPCSCRSNSGRALSSHLSGQPCHEKICLWGCLPGHCKTTEDGLSLEILDLESLRIVLSMW